MPSSPGGSHPVADPAPAGRVTALRAAEKLLRTGKLDLAVAEYERLVREEPSDWNTAVHLGRLYLRAGVVDKALTQLTTVADLLCGDRLLAQAAALYATILTIRHEDEHALLQSAEVACLQNDVDQARGHFVVLEALRASRGERRGAAEIRIRIGSLDPHDIDARIVAARARHELGDVDDAVTELKIISIDLGDQGRHGQALAVLEQVLEYAPEDSEARAQLFATCLHAGDLARARQRAATPADWRLLGLALAKAGDAEAIGVLREAARLNPDDVAIRARLAALFVAAGDAINAADYLLADMAGDDPALLLAIAEIQFRAGRIEDGVVMARQAVSRAPELIPTLATLADRAGAHLQETGWPIVECLVDALSERSDWSRAAESLQTFVGTAPSCIPALVRLVEAAIDGGLEPIAAEAQAMLADGYLAREMAAEALVVIEDLAAREPGDERHVERMRCALVMAGDAQPEAAIARRLSTLMAMPAIGGPAAAALPQRAAGTITSAPTRREAQHA